MAKSSDWLPPGRQDQLNMAIKWISVLQSDTAQNQQTMSARWGIPTAVVTEFAVLASDAETALRRAKNEETRTPVANARCKTAFGALAAKMRDIKKRWFHVPPLTDADLVSLGLKPHDATLTMSGTPAAQAAVETFLVGRRQLGVKIVYVTGNPDDAANKSYRIWYHVAAVGETPPESPDDLRKSYSTKRKKDVINFEFGDSGKTAYFAVQVENGKLKGPWGSMASALIP